MGVYIKNMEMPEKCGLCDLFYAESPMHCTVVKGHKTVGAPYWMPRPEWCPLVEVPENHGRLIDADAFAGVLEDVIKRQHYEHVTIDELLTVADVLTAVIDDLKGNTIVKCKNNPTVIDAEGE